MPELLKKSDENFLAANLLIQNKFFAPSVHCSYYSCFQKLKNVISQAYNSDYFELDTELKNINRNVSQGSRMGSHEFLIDRKLFDLVKRKKRDHRLINSMNDIKVYRKKSDYLNEPITEDVAVKAHNISQKVIKELNALI